MKKRALCALVSLALCVTLAGQAAAAESSVSFVVNGITLAADVPNRVEARTTYVSYWPIVSALYPNATAEWVNGQAEVKADGPMPCIWNLTMHVPADSSVCPMYLKTRKWFWDSLRLNPRSWRTKQL